MTFSNVSIFQNVISSLNTKGSNSVSDAIVKGGAFAPNTMESVSIMRTELDNQWENSFITSYQALMQNRLNRLKQDLTNAYNALLETSSVQQIGENIDSANNFAVTDIDGNIITDGSGKCEAFKDLTYYENETDFNADDGGTGTNKSTADGIPSYLKTSVATKAGTTAGSNVDVEMRKLYTTGSALQVTNDMKVTFRTEEVPATKASVDWLDPLISNLGQKPFVTGEKVAEYSTEVKTGGFWSTINYLFNFSPREISYQYATSYSTTTEEAGTRQKDGKQATLYDSVLLDGRDYSKDSSASDMNDSRNEYSTTDLPPEGGRIKWASSNSTEGYYVERSPFYEFLGGVVNGYKDDREIVRRVSDNDTDYAALYQTFNSAGDDVKTTWTDTDGKNGRTIKDYGTEENPNASFDQRVIWEYDQNGKSAADLNQDGDINDSDVHTAKAIFLNHYQVTTQTVKMNSDDTSIGTIVASNEKFLRSSGVDGSAKQTWTDLDNDKKVDTAEVNGEREKMLVAGSSNVSQNFSGTFVEQQHKIYTLNGQNIDTTDANVRFSSQADSSPIVIATYEGLDRAKSMSRGIATDSFSKVTQNIDYATAVTVQKDIQTEINASKTVDTDFHYSQYNNSGTAAAPEYDRVKFREIDSVTYTRSGGLETSEFKYDSSIKGTSDEFFKNINVGFRKTLNLESLDYCATTYGDVNVPSGTATDDPFFIDSPKYDRRNVLIKVDFNNGTSSSASPSLIVNGQVLTPAFTDTDGIPVFQVAPALETGDNVIAVQGLIQSNNNNSGLKVSAYTGTVGGGNDSGVINLINEKFSTSQTSTGDNVVSQLTGSVPPLSTWQSKIMTSLATTDASIDALGSKQTGTRVKDNNSFSKMLMDILNNPLYKDVFNLGLINSALGKDLVIKSDISAPTGGSITGVLNIKYDLNEKKFVLVQTKWDAAG